jgi:hypothetical protein
MCTCTADDTECRRSSAFQAYITDLAGVGNVICGTPNTCPSNSSSTYGGLQGPRTLSEVNVKQKKNMHKRVHTQISSRLLMLDATGGVSNPPGLGGVWPHTWGVGATRAKISWLISVMLESRCVVFVIPLTHKAVEIDT